MSSVTRDVTAGSGQGTNFRDILISSSQIVFKFYKISSQWKFRIDDNLLMYPRSFWNMDFFFLLLSKWYSLFEKFPVRKSCPRVWLCCRNSSPDSPGQAWHWPRQWRTILDTGHHFTSPPHTAQWESFISQADSTCLPKVHSVTVPWITCQDKWAVLCVK